VPLAAVPVEEPSHCSRADARRCWATLTRLIYKVDPLTCPQCGGQMRVIALIQEPKVIDKIQRHLRDKGRDARARGSAGVVPGSGSAGWPVNCVVADGAAGAAVAQAPRAVADSTSKGRGSSRTSLNVDSVRGARRRAARWRVYSPLTPASIAAGGERARCPVPSGRATIAGRERV
jgi:hypothetical protein